MSGEFHRQRSLASYNPWGHKKLDTNEQLTHTHTHTEEKLDDLEKKKKKLNPKLL